GSFEEHLRQLAAAPDQAAETSLRAQRFLTAFVRPHDLHVAAAKVIVEEIARVPSVYKRPYSAPLWHHPLRWALGAAVRAGFDPSLGATGRRRSRAGTGYRES
ncbi:MAG TPA: hypothetical protein VIX63_05360, partial [Vicinamibacterales bacterium]